MPNTIRTFIAISISDEILNNINKIIQKLKPACPAAVRWVNPNGIHLTLKFLGEIPTTKVRQISDSMGLSVQGQKPFSFQVQGLGAFSRAEQPRVLWVGLEKSPELKVLQNTLDLNLKKIGVSAEKRPFNPHLTIARVKDQNNPVDLQKITQVLSQNQTGSLGTLNVKEICLFQSELKPGGAVYTRLFTAKLG